MTSKALALAGIMGGADSAVSDTTADIFLESAFFDPGVIAGKSRILGFGSDSSYRFERGVDFAGTVQRAGARDATGARDLRRQGRAGERSAARHCRSARRCACGSTRAARLLGIELGVAEVGDMLRRLGFEFTAATATYST